MAKRNIEIISLDRAFCIKCKRYRYTRKMTKTSYGYICNKSKTYQKDNCVIDKNSFFATQNNKALDLLRFIAEMKKIKAEEGLLILFPETPRH